MSRMREVTFGDTTVSTSDGRARPLPVASACPTSLTARKPALPPIAALFSMIWEPRRRTEGSKSSAVNDEPTRRPVFVVMVAVTVAAPQSQSESPQQPVVATRRHVLVREVRVPSSPVPRAGVLARTDASIRFRSVMVCRTPAIRVKQTGTLTGPKRNVHCFRWRNAAWHTHYASPRSHCRPVGSALGCAAHFQG